MAINETTYRVTTEYLVKDQGAENKIAGIGRAAQHAERRTSALKRTLLGFAGGFGVWKGVDLGRKYLIGFNSDMQQIKMSLATTIGGQMHESFQRADRSANKLFRTLQTGAKASSSITAQWAQMAQMISGSVLSAGLGVKGLATITRGAMIAGQTYAGGDYRTMGMEIDEMLSGQVSSRQRYAKQLLSAIGWGSEAKLKQFRAMSGAQRAKIVEQSLNTPIIREAAKHIGNTYKGQLSTLEDQLQITLGRVGKPLFHDITNELKIWNKWILENTAEINRFADKFGHALGAGFKDMEKLAGWVGANKHLLENLAKAALVLEGTKTAAGFLSLRGGRGGVGGGGLVGVATKGLIAYATTEAIAGTARRHYDAAQFLATKRALGSFARDSDRAHAMLGLKNARAAGILKDLSVNRARLLELSGAGAWVHGEFRKRFLLGDYDKMTRKQMILAGGMTPGGIAAMGQIMRLEKDIRLFGKMQDYAARAEVKHLASLGEKWAKELIQVAPHWQTTLEQLIFHKAKQHKDFTDAGGGGHHNHFHGDVKISVAAKDPDRWIRDMSDALGKKVRAPTQARNALGGGGL